MAALRGAGPFAFDTYSYNSAASDFSANLDPLSDEDQRNILAKPFISVVKMEANNNYEREDLKGPEIGDAQNTANPQLGDEDDSGDEEVWESVSELASDEEYVTDDGEEGEGEEVEFEEGEDDDEDDDDEEEDDDDSMAEEEEEDEEVEGDVGMDDATMSSGDEGGEKCAICLSAFRDQEVGMPESCDHAFCFECIYEWSKNVTTCPVDRSVFTLILVRNTIHGEIVRQMEVKAQKIIDEDQDPTYCEVCGECDREDRLLLCDECDAGYHCECLTPPLVDIPIEEWYCPNCATANHDDVSSEEEYMAELRRPLRRVREYARAIARTQVAERVLSRVRQARELRRIDEEEQAGTSTATRAPRVPKPRRKTTRKRKSTKRKTTKRKTTKRKTTKRKTTKRKKRKTTSSTTATGTKKKRRKTTRRKRKVRRTSVGARTAQPAVAKTIRRRIAGKLNLVSPKVGSMMPDMKQKGEHSLLFKRHDIGVASLTLTGGDHIFDPSGYDESPIIRRPGAQSAPTPAKPLPSASPGPSSGGGALDLLGSILQGQNILHMKSENITIHKDGTLSSARKKDDASSPKKSPTKTAHRPSASSATSHHHNSEKLKSNTIKLGTHNDLQGQRSSQHQGQRRSESSSGRRDSISKRMSQEIDYDDGIDDMELVEMDIDEDDDYVGGGGGDAAITEDLRRTSKMDPSREASQREKPQRQGSNSYSENTRTKGNVSLDWVHGQVKPHSTEEKHQGQKCEDRDEETNDESDSDVGYHGNSDNQGGEEDDGYQQAGDEEDGNHDENAVNNNNNNNGDGGDGGEEEGGGGEDGGEGDGEGEEQDDDNEEEVEEEEEEEEEEGVEGEMKEEHAAEFNTIEEGHKDSHVEAEDGAEIYEEAEVEKEEPLEGINSREYDPAEDVEWENDGDKEYDPELPIEEYSDVEQDGLQEGEDSNQNDICEDGEDKDEDQEDEEELEDEQEIEEEEEEEEEVQEEEEQEGDEQDEAQEEHEIQQSGPEVENSESDQHREEQNVIEEGQGRGNEAKEEEREDDEEEDSEAEEGEEIDDDQNSQEIVNVNENAQEESDEMKLKSGIGKLECEDISDEDNVPEGDGDEVESDEEGMIIETSDGRFIEAKPKSKTSRTPRRSEKSEARETSADVTESDVKHGPSSAEEGEVKTDDESKKGKKTRGKRKRKPKKRNRDKRNVVVDPRKSISLQPQMPPDLSRLPKRGEEPSSRREGSRESYGDLRQVIQVKRDTPYTAEELRRYHEEYWEEYNRRRDERRVERVGSSWDQYTYDQYAYYEAWRSMGGEFATGRPWGLHVQRDRSPIYDRRKNGAEPQVFDPRLEALRQSARKESERGKDEGPSKSGEKKPKSDSDSSRKDHTTKKDGSRSQKDEKDKLKKEKTKEKSKGLVHENSARDKNGRERGGSDKDKRYHEKEKEKIREKENRDKHGHDKEKDRSRHKEREKSRERERSRKDSDHRSRDKERHRSPVRERSRDRVRERSRDRYHKRSRETERSRSKDNDHSRSRHRSRSRDRSRDRSHKRDRSSESDRVSSRDRRKDKPRDKVQDRGREKDIRTSRNQNKDKERERSRDTVRTKKTEEMKSTSSSKVPLRKERGKVTVDASGVRKILLGEKSKPKAPKKVVEKPATAVIKVEKTKVKKIKKDKAGGENKVEKKGKKTKVKGEKKLTKGKKKKAAAKRPLSFDVEEITAPPVKKKASSAAVVQAKKIEDVVLKPPSPLKFDDADDMVPVPSTTRSVSRSPDLYIDITVPDNDLSRIVAESPKVVFKAKSPADVAVADSSHLENDMYDPFEPTASPSSGIKSPSPIPSEASPRHDTATSSSLEVFTTKRASTPPPEVPPDPTSTTDVSSSDMATNPSQPGMTNEDRLMLASQASQQITKILNQLATVPVTKPPRVSPESPDELAMSSASIELGLSPEHIHGSSLSVSSLGSDHKNFKVDPIVPEDNAGDGPEDDIEMSAVDLYNKNSRDRYLKKLYHQERVVEEVKLAIKPHYQRKVINKEDYKEILRKSVTQVCHSKTGEINPVKIRRLIDGYVKKAQHKSKKPGGGDGHKSSKQGGGSAGKSGFKSSSRGPSKGSSKASKEPASASKLIEKGRSLGLKSKSK